jgi:hypothetical protein
MSKKPYDQKCADDKHIKLINDRIDDLRVKCLDLSRRNPLISTKFSNRSNSLVRVVDEIPELLVETLLEKPMRISPLPDLGTDPNDENAREFQDALAEARLNDEIYLNAIDQINEEDDDAPDLLAQAERQLKDRLRSTLGMTNRQTKDNLSLQEHAKNHGISAHFELPYTHESHDDGRHSDYNMQTLLLPDMLERRLNALISRERAFEEETGISVLHAAFGFLEWEDGNNSSKQLSPLLLIPVQIEKKRTRNGQEFWVSSDEATLEENKVLAEKLRIELNITLPEYTEQGLEKYFEEVSKQCPKNTMWRVKRWAVIGVFPSAKLAMYHDLSTEQWNFTNHPVVATLLAGTKTQGGTPFGDEYEVDDPDIANKVPYLITDADSSQFSTLVDVSDGKNVAVEGPPGTGKSQTIVNAIAAALATGKTILFVAEKAAALEVVGARLEAFGLGNFLLPLQATRSSKEQVIASVKNRIEMTSCKDPAALDDLIKKREETKLRLKSYIELLASNFEKTNFTIHKILGNCIKYTNLFLDLPANIKSLPIKNVKNLSSNKLEDILHECKNIQNRHQDTLKYSGHWKNANISNIDPFQANDLLGLAQNLSTTYTETWKLREHLSQYNLPPLIDIEDLEIICNTIDEISHHLSETNILLLQQLASADLIEEVKAYLSQAKKWRCLKDQLTRELQSIPNQSTLENFQTIKKILQKYDLDSLQSSELETVIHKSKSICESAHETKKLRDKCYSISEGFNNITTTDLIKTIEILASSSPEALAVRSADLDDLSTQIFIQKQSTIAKNLKEEQADLKNCFFLTTLPASEVISMHAAILLKSGIFSILSKHFRDAKRFYNSISKAEKFKKAQAAQELIKLAEWHSENEFFSKNQLLKKITGIQYDGLDTNFTPYIEAISLFKKIDQDFQENQFTSLRNFCKEEKLQIIKLLPVLGNNHPIYKLPTVKLLELETFIKNAEQKRDDTEHDMHHLKTLRNNFVAPDDISIRCLDELQKKAMNYLSVQASLQDNTKTTKIFREIFNLTEDNDIIINKNITVATFLTSLNSDYRAALLTCIRNNTTDNLHSLLIEIKKSAEQSSALLTQLANITNSTLEDWQKDKSPKEISSFMQIAAQDREGLFAHSRLVAALNTLDQYGYREIAPIILDAGFKLLEVIKALIMKKMAETIYHTYGETLSLYDGSQLDTLRKRFQELDNEVIRLSRQRLQATLCKNTRSIPAGIGQGKKSEYTEDALLRHEISKKQRHIPIRQLTQRASEALLKYKPCWMMSPLAIAQYLPKNTIEFDLVIIDEASQMTPENSVGALIRAKQAMVVGDTNQLPPTDFFKKNFEDESADEDIAVTEESILEMANSCFRPIRRLRWHYRSKHSGLISFSNKHVYNNDLVIFPSAQEDDPDMGVSLVKVDGEYATGSNKKEAKVMVDNIINFMKKRTNKSLGVVLLNQKQRDLLIDEMNFASNHHPHVKEYIELWESQDDGIQRFFIKNLENVQGDERDVIFIGTVYGPEKEGGPVMQRFGPINGIAGKRRLNVLFSRAKEKIITFTSMLPPDIRADENGNPGTYMLKCWLEYSASGIIESGKVTEKEPDSEFEEYVIQQVKTLGCEAVPQVGVKGYSIDIGVKHPNWPHGFLMGIECDGATYHSSYSARDRDRLRQQVLEGLGWKLYRIWSTDWFTNPKKETEKLRVAIKKRLDELTEPDRNTH